MNSWWRWWCRCRLGVAASTLYRHLPRARTAVRAGSIHPIYFAASEHLSLTGHHAASVHHHRDQRETMLTVGLRSFCSGVR